MKRELGIARCGLACCLCSKNTVCLGCNSGGCSGKEWCENRKCSIEKDLEACYACAKDCRKGFLSKIKPYAFTVFVKEYGIDKLLNCLEENEKRGIVYHREGFTGDYDNFDSIDDLIQFIKTGNR